MLFSGSFIGDGTDAHRIGADGRVDAVLAKGGDLAELCEVVRELAAQTGKRAKSTTKEKPPVPGIAGRGLAWLTATR